MANRINREMMNILKDAIREVSRDVNAYSDSTWLNETKTVTWKVNWGAWGNQSAQVAREYAQKLMLAATIVDGLNSLELVDTFEHDAELYALIQTDRESAVGLRNIMKQTAMRYIVTCAWDKLPELLCNRPIVTE